MPSEGYVREKLSAAMDALATSAAPIQRRLAAAAGTLVHLGPEDFLTDEDRALFEEIMEPLTRRAGAGGEGAIDASTAELDDDAAETVARKVAELHDRYVKL